ncbi:MAG: 3-isopropylmalate dehydratase [Gammaproteobacteria bacterium]|nr:3-isopropylmalate dehydratase [Gammaproteobacteria bacterium]
MSSAAATRHVVSGAAWVFGDEINTDAMAPGLYFKESMAVMAQHCLETVNPDFAANVRPGDIVVGGRNFGVGSAREQAPMALQHLGVGAIIAVSFSRIFYRNAINFGLPVMRLPEAGEISPGDHLTVDPEAGQIINTTSGASYAVEPIPPHMMAMIAAGGLMPWLKARIAGNVPVGSSAAE